MARWNRRWVFGLLLLSGASLHAQVNRYFVFFKDKQNTPYAIERPAEFLSARSLQRRARNNVSVTEEDLPVNPAYVAQVQTAGVSVFFTSKWWNGVLIECEAAQVAAVQQLASVARVELVAPGRKLTQGRSKRVRDRSRTDDVQQTDTQLQQLGLTEMHAQGYRGEGILIAVFDSGFTGVDTASPFAHLFSDSRLTYTFNYVHNVPDVYDRDDHGTEVLSVLAAQSANYTGAAPKATYQLYLTEDVSSEYRIEEYNWTFAAERADSMGVDVINTSLGYNTFDENSMDYALADLTGEKAVISIAAAKALARGMVLVTSAGNEGNISSWRKVTPPADVEGVLAVGSVNALGMRSSFSSIGPTADGRIKPDVMAMGSGTAVVRPNGSVSSASGTSVASPLVAGLSAGLLQAYPQLTARHVYNVVLLAGSQSATPDNQHGFGIPNFTRVNVTAIEEEDCSHAIYVYPNPVTQNSVQIRMSGFGEEAVHLSVYSQQGQLLAEQHLVLQAPSPVEYDLSMLTPGTYLVKVKTACTERVIRLVKL